MKSYRRLLRESRSARDLYNMEESQVMVTDTAWSNKKHLVILFMILLLGGIIRFYQLGQKSFWTDELVTIANAIKMTDVNAFFAHTREDDLPKFYSLVLKLWLVFGESEFATRSLSVLFGCAAIPVIYAIGRLFYDAKTAISAAFLAAISPFLLIYDREVRMYSMFSFLSLLSTYFFVRAIRENKKLCWWLYAFVNILNLYTHYYALMTIGVQWLFLLIRNKNYRHIIKPWLLANIVMFLFFAVRLSALINDVLYFAPWAIPRERFPFIFGKEFVEFFYIFYSFSAGQTILPWNPAAVFSFVSVIVCFIFAIKKWVLYSQDTLYLILLIFAPIIIGLVFRISMPRYFTFIAPIFFIFVARGLWLIPAKVMVVIAILITLGWTYGLSNYYRGKEFHIMAHVDPWREVATYLKENVKQDETLFPLGIGVVPLSHYYGHQIKGYQEDDVMKELNKVVDLRTSKVWLLLTFQGEYDNWLKAREILSTHYKVVREEKWGHDPDFELKKRLFRKAFTPYRIVAELYERKD